MRLAAVVPILVTLSASSALAQTPLGTTFTYQGRLQDNGQPASGPYDLRFTLFDAPVAGTAIGSPIVKANVAVGSGLFTVSLDFGAAGPVFSGNARWLEIGVRPGGTTGAFTVLAPRQELTPSPNAIFSSSADDAARLGGQPPASYQLRITGVCPAGQAIRQVNANGSVTCETAGSGTVVSVAAGTGLTGGTITTSGTLGVAFGGAGTATTAARSDHAHLGQTWTGTGTGLRVESTTTDGLEGVTSATSGGIGVLGQSFSTSGSGVRGQAIATTGSAHGVFGETSSAQGYGAYGVNGAPGGAGAVGFSTASTGGGSGVHGITNGSTGIGVLGSAQQNASGQNYGVFGESASSNGTGVWGQASRGVVGASTSTSGAGVFGMALQPNGTTAGVRGASGSSTGLGGYFENTGGGAALGVNAGGIRYGDGTVQTTAAATGWSLTGNAGTNPATNFIGTTDNQAIELRVNGSRALRLEPSIGGNVNVVGGFDGNSVTNGVGSVIGGGGAPGSPNSVVGQFGTVSGGFGDTSGMFATVGGGNHNSASGNYSTVAGGDNNLASGSAATVPGGSANEAAAILSFAAGQRAKVGPTHTGTFVWSDAQNGDFSSTGTNQFLVRAAGGVGINTNAPAGAALAVNGTATVSGNVGVGTTAPHSRLHVTGGSVYIGAPNSLVITSPNGTCWFITVNDAGALGAFAVACP